MALEKIPNCLPCAILKLRFFPLMFFTIFMLNTQAKGSTINLPNQDVYSNFPEMGIKDEFDSNLYAAESINLKSNELTIFQLPRRLVNSRSAKVLAGRQLEPNLNMMKQKIQNPGNGPDIRSSAAKTDQSEKNEVIASQIQKSLTYEAWNDRMPRIGKNHAIGHIKIKLNSTSIADLKLDRVELMDGRGQRLSLEVLSESKPAQKQNSLNESSAKGSAPEKYRSLPKLVDSYHMRSPQAVKAGDKLHLSFFHGGQRTEVELVIQNVLETY